MQLNNTRTTTARKQMVSHNNNMLVSDNNTSKGGGGAQRVNDDSDDPPDWHTQGDVPGVGWAARAVRQSEVRYHIPRSARSDGGQAVEHDQPADGARDERVDERAPDPDGVDGIRADALVALAHEALRVAGLAQLATHALQAEGEAASIGGEWVKRRGYDRRQLGGAGERWRQGLGERGADSRGFEDEVTLRSHDDMGIASELGFRRN